jgi:hypothetical protein
VDAERRAGTGVDLDVERGRRSVEREPAGREEHPLGQGCEVHVATAEPRTLDHLAQSGSRRLGSVYYRASCPACGQPAVWHDQAVGQLPGLAVVRTTSEVVACTTCDSEARLP